MSIACISCSRIRCCVQRMNFLLHENNTMFTKSHLIGEYRSILSYSPIALLIYGRPRRSARGLYMAVAVYAATLSRRNTGHIIRLGTLFSQVLCINPHVSTVSGLANRVQNRAIGSSRYPPFFGFSTSFHFISFIHSFHLFQPLNNALRRSSYYIFSGNDVLHRP